MKDNNPHCAAEGRLSYIFLLKSHNRACILKISPPNPPLFTKEGRCICLVKESGMIPAPLEEKEAGREEFLR